MQGRGSCRLDPATSIQEQKYVFNRTLPVWKTSTVFSDCHKWNFSISIFEDPKI